MTKHMHGKIVKQMAMTSGKSYTRESLLQEIADKFGAETRFYSCGAENMVADELLSFFIDNGKLDTADYTFSPGEHQDHEKHDCKHPVRAESPA